MTDKEKNNILDAKNIRDFWEGRALRYRQQSLINVSNLEADPDRASEKENQESKVIMEYVRPETGQRILDLGAGHCAWSIMFSRIVAHVDAVEYAHGMLELAKQNIAEHGIENIHLYHCAAQDFVSKWKYETVFISGLTIYLSDSELSVLLQRIKRYLPPGGRVVLRDGTGKINPFTISNRFSDELGANYSAHYRTSAQYTDWFQKNGFVLLRDQNMFPDGSPLNKRKETILRIYEFRML